MVVFAASVDPPWWAFALFFLAMLAVALFARNRDAEDARRILARDPAARGLGVFVIAMGLGLGYLLAYGPISEAGLGGRIVLVRRGAVGVPATVVFLGLVLLAAGRHWERFLPAGRSGDLTRLRWGIILVALAVGLGSELAFDGFFRARGYFPFR